MQISSALSIVREETTRARKTFPPFNSPHEGLAVIQEEFEFLKAEVFKNKARRSQQNMKKEAVHLAAMAVRFLIDLT